MTKSQILSALAVVTILLGVASPVLAEETDATMTREQKQAQIEANKAELRKQKEAAKENKEERQEKRQENREERNDKKAAGLAKHCENVEERLNKLIEKIEARIAKQKADGKSTTEAEAKVAEAKAALASGISLCEQAVAKYDSVPADEWATQKAVIAEARSLAKQAHDAFVKARQALAQAIRVLMQNHNKSTTSPTPSASPTPTASPASTQ